MRKRLVGHFLRYGRRFGGPIRARNAEAVNCHFRDVVISEAREGNQILPIHVRAYWSRNPGA